jgi:hypothetical protein
MSALDYLAEWFADGPVIGEEIIHGFDPPREFVDLVATRMLSEPTLGWSSYTQAYADLADMWPDCKALDDVERTVT